MNEKIQRLRDKYAYRGKEEPSKVVKSRPSRTKKEAAQDKTKKFKYHPSEITYGHLKEVPDLLRPGLKLVFCGFNPGIQSAKTGHRYAHHSNLFWKLMIESGLFATPIRDVKSLTWENSDRYLFDNAEIGFTDLVSRATRNIGELSSTEMNDMVPALVEKFLVNQPKAVCFIGKDIYKRLFNYMKAQTGRKEINFDKTFVWGQQKKPDHGVDLISTFFKQQQTCDAQSTYVPIIYTFPSTSGLVGSIPRDLKLQLFTQLKEDLHSRS